MHHRVNTLRPRWCLNMMVNCHWGLDCGLLPNRQHRENMLGAYLVRNKYAPSSCMFGAHQTRTNPSFTNLQLHQTCTYKVRIWCATNTHLTFIYIFSTAPNTHLLLLKLCLNSEGKRTNNTPTQRTNVLGALRTKCAPAHHKAISNICGTRSGGSWYIDLRSTKNQAHNIYKWHLVFSTFSLKLTFRFWTDLLNCNNLWETFIDITLFGS